jgi:imidazolonepropionase-like amidohydrolase
MNSKVLALLLSVLLHSGCQSSKELYDGDATFITNISIIDPLDGLKEKQTIMIKEGKIEKVVPSDQFVLSPRNKIIDGTGKFLMPGLWDSHVHFAYIEELAPRMFDLFLGYGITSVRDTGGKKEFVNNYKNLPLKNPQASPRVMIAGPLLDGDPNVYDGSDHSHPPLSVKLSNVDDLKREVKSLDSLGVDFLKAYEMLTPDQFKALLALGKELGLKVTGHVPLSMDVVSASNAGLNSMEHLRNLELSCASNAEGLLKQRQEMLAKGARTPGGELRSAIHDTQRVIAIKNFDEKKAREILHVLKANDTWQIPTLALNTFSTENFMANAWWTESIKSLPAGIRAEWIESVTRLGAMEPTEFRRNYSLWMFNMVKMVHEEKITIMAGTDTPIALQTPGVSLHNELAMLVKAGLSPLDAIRAATINPAKYFSLENELGLVRDGYWADLLIVDDNPLENIENTRKIFAVVKQGKYYGREELNKMLEDQSTKR